MLTPAKTWEANGDYTRAIEAYLKMTVLQTTDYALLEEVWYKALELALKFVPTKAKAVGKTVAERLAEISRFESVSSKCYYQYYKGADFTILSGLFNPNLAGW